MSQRGRILLVEDDEAFAAALRSRLEAEGFEAVSSNDGEAALEHLTRSDFDAVATELDLGSGLSGIALAERISALREIPIVVLTRDDSYENAVAALRTGVFDFLAKPIGVESVVLALARAVRHHRMVSQLQRLKDQPRVPDADFGILGKSRAVRQVKELIRRVGPSNISVLVTGESGTGKELVARALHDCSPRAQHRYVAINCAAVPEQLLESELFGYTKGAFTDAKEDRDGLFVQAHGGTLFLDEVGEMPLGMQAKLLRALEENRVRPVGASREVEFDTRIVAATNVDLEDAIEDGRFREDLFYRLNVVSIALPPLRARETDVLLIAQALLERESEEQGRAVTGISQPAASKLMAYGWPGNVRELANVMARAVVLTQFDDITVDDLPKAVQSFDDSMATEDLAPELISLADLERRHIQRVLESMGGHRGRAAEVLQIDRRTLYRKLKRYGLESEE